MNTQAAVDPALLSALALFPQLDLSRDTLGAIRAGLAEMVAATPLPRGLAAVRTERIVPDVAPDADAAITARALSLAALRRALKD